MEASKIPVQTPLALHAFVPVSMVGGHERMLISWLARARSLGLLNPVITSGRNEHFLQWCAAEGLPVAHPGVFEEDGGGKLARMRNAWRMIKNIRALDGAQLVLIAPGTVQSAMIYSIAALMVTARLVIYVPMAYPSDVIGYGRPKFRDGVMRRLIKRTLHWITISSEQKDLLLTYWHASAPVSVIRNAIQVKTTARASKILGSPRPVQLVFIGRFDVRQKGLDWLLGFFADNPVMTQGFELLLKGGGGDSDRIAELVNQLNARAPGFVTVESWGDPSGVYATADALILPSRFEGVPLVGLEAIAAGIPVLATLQSGLNGLLPVGALFEFGDNAALQASLSSLLVPGAVQALHTHQKEAVAAYLDEAKRDAEITACVESMRLALAASCVSRTP